MNDPNESVTRLLRFRRAVEQLIEDVLPGPADSLAGSGPPVPLDVFVRPDAVEVLVEIPGVRPDMLEVSASGRRVLIEGQRSAEPHVGGSFLCLERAVGRFRRVVELPVAADSGRATATLTQGVLKITVPRIRDRRGTARPIVITTNAV